MANDLDHEVLALMTAYGGRDPRIPHSVKVIVFSDYADTTWPLDDFISMLCAMRDKIPAECRASAVVALDSHGEGSGELNLSFDRLQTAEEVAACVARARAYAEGQINNERAAFERLKIKFGK